MNLEQLAAHRTIDLTTVGRRSGAKRRIEIWWFRVGDRFIITGTPGPRGWLANVLEDPSITVHVGGEDIPARAIVITDQALRRQVFTHTSTSWYSSQAELDRLVAESPMIEVVFDAR